MCFQQRLLFSSEFAWEIRHSWGTPGIWIGYHPLDFRFHLLRRLCREMPKEQAIWWGFWWGLNTLKRVCEGSILRIHQFNTPRYRINRFMGPTKLLWFFFFGGLKAVVILLNPGSSGFFGFFGDLWWSYLVKLLQMMVCNNHPATEFVKNFRSCWSPPFFASTPSNTEGAQLELPAELELERNPGKKLWGSWE